MAAPKEGHVIGFGNPLLDISTAAPASLLEKYDLKNANAILAEEKHLPLYKELVDNYKVEYIAGGSAQNSIRALQWMLQTPKVARYVGAIGADDNGKILKAQAEKDGVDPHYLVVPDHPTGTCAVLVVEKDRSLVANLAAANHYKKTHLESAEIQKIVDEAQVIYTTGFFLTHSTDSAVALGEHAAKNNKVLAWNLSAPFVAEFFFDNVKSVLPYVDIVFGNETEAAAISKKFDWGEDLKVIAEKIATLPKTNAARPRVVIITHGAQPAIVYAEGKIHEFAPKPLDATKIIDTNGAGDCFVGGFLSRYIKGASLEECVMAGHYCAQLVIQVSGCTLQGTPAFTFA